MNATSAENSENLSPAWNCNIKLLTSAKINRKLVLVNIVKVRKLNISFALHPKRLFTAVPTNIHTRMTRKRERERE